MVVFLGLPDPEIILVENHDLNPTRKTQVLPEPNPGTNLLPGQISLVLTESSASFTINKHLNYVLFGWGESNGMEQVKSKGNNRRYEGRIQKKCVGAIFLKSDLSKKWVSG